MTSLFNRRSLFLPSLTQGTSETIVQALPWVGVFATERVIPTYTGPIMRVVRTTDYIERDVYAQSSTNSRPDWQDIKNFRGGTTGNRRLHVARVYNQAGGNDLIQPGFLNQPELNVEGRVFDFRNPEVAKGWVYGTVQNSSGGELKSAYTKSQPFSVVLYAWSTETSANQSLVNFGLSDSVGIRAVSGIIRMDGNPTQGITSGKSGGSWRRIVAVFDGANSILSVNGTVTTGSAGEASLATFMVGLTYNFSLAFQGMMNFIGLVPRALNTVEIAALDTWMASNVSPNPFDISQPAILVGTRRLRDTYGNGFAFDWITSGSSATGRQQFGQDGNVNHAYLSTIAVNTGEIVRVTRAYNQGISPWSFSGDLVEAGTIHRPDIAFTQTSDTAISQAASPIQFVCEDPTNRRVLWSVASTNPYGDGSQGLGLMFIGRRTQATTTRVMAIQINDSNNQGIGYGTTASVVEASGNGSTFNSLQLSNDQRNTFHRLFSYYGTGTSFDSLWVNGQRNAADTGATTPDRFAVGGRNDIDYKFRGRWCAAACWVGIPDNQFTDEFVEMHDVWLYNQGYGVDTAYGS